MKKIVALLLLMGFAAFSQPILAADKAAASSKAEHPLTFWEKLRKKINMFTPQKKLEATTAVGGVRGAQTEVNDVYWKGEANHMINAEELGVTSKNVDEKAKSENPEIRRLLGFEGNFGEAMGLYPKWAYRIVKLVGNYGEIFDRNLGEGSPLKIKRGMNALWSKGGLLYAPPIR